MVIVCSHLSTPFTGMPSVDQVFSRHGKRKRNIHAQKSVCRLVYVHAQKSDGILYIFVVVCRGCCNIVYHCMKFIVSQCSMNMHRPIALCTEVHY